jgi:succinyl-diaminopimelate desuccinylase
VSANVPAEIAARVDPERIKELTLALVRIPSPPGDEKRVAEYYAQELRGLRMDVEMDEEFPSSPSVIARCSRRSMGRTLQFDGHSDHIAAPGPTIEFRDGYIYGRGSEDMKASLAAMAEAARVVIESGVELQGNLLLTAHGRHESATNETLDSLIAKGVHGDAVVVTELGGHTLPIAGMGLVFWDMEIRRPGEILHETVVPKDTPNPVQVGVEVINRLNRRAAEFANRAHPYLGVDTIFVGQFSAGDYNNRVPNRAFLQGTWRFAPPKGIEQVRAELETLGREVGAAYGVDIQVNANGVTGYEISPQEPLVQVLQKAHLEVTGNPLPLTGTRAAANVPNFVHGAHIPALYYGATYLTAHSDVERVELAQVVRACRVYVHTILNYLGYTH